MIKEKENSDPFIEALGFERCDTDKECDYCQVPTNGSYAKMFYPGDDNPECEYVICGKCIIENQKRNQGRFVYTDLPKIKLPF